MVVSTDATIQHLWSVILQVLHKSSLCVIHQIVLVWRSTGILWVVESRSRGVWIGAKIVYVEVLVDAHQATVAIARVVKGSIGVTTDRASTIGELASCIRFIWLVKRVCMIVCSLFSATADGCMIATVVVDYISAARADRGEVSDVQWSPMILHVASSHVAVDRLLSRMISTSMMEPSLVELVGSNLTKGILIFSRTSAEVATIALVDWVACSARSPLLSQLGFGNRLRY